MVYYNEFDPKVAAWLRELINMGSIANGHVDERSIVDVSSNDLKGYDQHHFFAGIGGWSYALRLAQYPDDTPVWTASLPCQPFSAAGKGLGKNDERHLLPHFLELVKECRPNVLFGEQVEGAIAHGWLDDLQTNMEAEGYAVGHCVLGAHSVGAAHIRQRLYWVANSVSDCDKRAVRGVGREAQTAQVIDRQNVAISGESRGASADVCGVGYPSSATSERDSRGLSQTEEGVNTPRLVDGRIGFGFANASEIDWMADTAGKQREHQPNERPSSLFGAPIQQEERFSRSSNIRTTPDIDWIYCRDNKYRPIKSGIKPLVNGIARGMVHSCDSSEPINANETQEARTIRLKGYGNAIVPQLAAEFIKAWKLSTTQNVTQTTGC